MTSTSDRDDLERRLAAMLSERAAAVEVHSDPDAAFADPFGAGGRHSGRRRMLAAAAASIVVLGLGLLTVVAVQDPEGVLTDTVRPAPAPSTNPATTPSVSSVDSSLTTSPASTTTPAPVIPVVPDTTAPGPVTNGWLALVSGSGDIYLVRPGEDARRLGVAGSDATEVVCPTWSPDGTRLLFGQLAGSNDDFSDPELVIVPVGPDGAAGAPTVIALDGFDDSDPHLLCAIWAPDGRWVALAGGGEVWAVDTQTGEIRRLPDLRPIDFEWRPGTDELAIAGDIDAEVSTPISIYSVSTGELRQLESIQASQLTWSPDGTTIAFARVSRVGSGDLEHDSTSLWLVDANGTNERPLVADPFDANHGIGPVWSPTGDRIAYQRVCCGSEGHEVVLVDVADGTQTVIAPPQTDGPNGPVQWYPWTVTWSPDGTTLLYTAWSAYRPGSTERNRVLAVPADTPSDVTVLADRTFLPANRKWVLVQNWGRQP